MLPLDVLLLVASHRHAFRLARKQRVVCCRCVTSSCFCPTGCFCAATASSRANTKSEFCSGSFRCCFPAFLLISCKRRALKNGWMKERNTVLSRIIYLDSSWIYVKTTRSSVISQLLCSACIALASPVQILFRRCRSLEEDVSLSHLLLDFGVAFTGECLVESVRNGHLDLIDR